MKHTLSPSGVRFLQRGFSLVELSMVLIVIALIAGAVAVGGDLQRNASYQRLGSSFVRGWQLSYLSYKTKYGYVINDTPGSPTGFVNANTTGADGSDVCGVALRTAMLGAGAEMPQGRSEGKEDRYSYLDSNGNPQEMSVCFRAIRWLSETGTPGTYDEQAKNVMVINQVTPDLARMIDSLVDTARDAQFGKVRQYPRLAAGGLSGVATVTSPPLVEYSLNNTCVQGGACTTAYDEAQVATMTIYYLMD